MIISKRHKGCSTCDLKCDECGKIWKGNYYVWRKKSNHYCPSCSLKMGWKNKYSKMDCNIPESLKPYILKRLDSGKLDDWMPKKKSIKVIIKCSGCGEERRSNAYDVLDKCSTLCNSCTQIKKIKNGEYDYSYRQTQKYREMMREAIKNSEKYRNSIPLRIEKTKKYWEKVRGHKKYDEWILYKKRVYSLSEKTYRRYKDIINPDDLPRGRRKYHLDHKYSVLRGFKNCILPYILSHPCNLEMLKSSDNIAKDFHCSITKEELFEGVYGTKTQL